MIVAFFRKTYALVSVALVALGGQLAGLVFGDCGWIYYYAAMVGLSTGWGLVGALFAMRKIQDPLWLAMLAQQMRREVDEGDHHEVVELHYAHLYGVTETAAEAREPGVVRRAWALREHKLKTENESNNETR